MSEKFEKIKYWNNYLPNIKRSVEDPKRYRFRVKVKQKQHVKIFVAPAGSKTKMIEAAIDAFRVFREEIENALGWNNALAASERDILVSDYFEKYIKRNRKKREWTAAYIKAMKSRYEKYIKNIIGAKVLHTVNPNDITAIQDGLINSRTGRKLSLSTQKAVTELLKAIFSAAINDELTERNPVKDEHKIKRDRLKEKKVILGAEEKFLKVHAAIHHLYKHDHKLKAIFLFGLSSRRLSEVLSLRWSDIDMKTKKYRIRKDKNDLTSTYSMNDEIFEALKGIYRSRSRYIFPSKTDSSKHITFVGAEYQRIRDHTGIQEFNFHYMRNLLVSTAVSRGGIENAEFSSMLGHKDINTINQYITLNREGASGKILGVLDELIEESKKK